MTRSLIVSNLVLWLTVAWFSTGLAAQGSATAQGDQAAQIEKGRLVVAQACTTCHTTLGRMLQVHKQTAPQWKDTVYFMISRGAQVMPDEIDAVAAFLAATAGRGGPAQSGRGGQGQGR
jgi:mono/diheme cytochrome c family protein